MSNVREMIQIAFEYEAKLHQATQKIAELERALASYQANSKPLAEAKALVKE